MSSRVISISTGTILRTVAILIGIVLLWMIRDIILYLFSALILAGVMYPIAEGAKEKYKIPKGITVAILYILLIGIIAILFSLMIPNVLSEAKGLVNSYGQSFSWLKDWLGNLKEFSNQVGLGKNVEASLAGLQSQITTLLENLVTGLTDLFGSITGFIVLLALALYLILEDNSIKQICKTIIPAEYQTFAAHVTWQIMKKLGDWLRSQFLIALLIGLVYFVILSALHIPFPFVLAFIGGLLEFIPFIGPIIAVASITAVAFSVSPARALLTVIILLVIHQLNGHFIAPKIMQKTTGLNPVVSIVAFMIGAKLFGPIGAIFAIPIATAASVFLQEMFIFTKPKPLPSHADI